MKYSGGCHCGAVRFTVEMTIESVLSCNCSICHKRGHLLAFAPDNTFILESGDDHLTDYQFNKKVIHHLFCKTCGVGAFGRGMAPDGTAVCAINIRCLDDVDIAAFPVVNYNGKDL